MHNIKTRTCSSMYFVALAILLIGADLQAQDPGLDPVEAAGMYVVQKLSYDTLPPGALVVDVVGSRFLHDTGVVPTDGPLPPEARAAAARIATRLGARPGSLEDVMKCKDRPPTPEEFQWGRRRCRLIGNTKRVLQLGDVKETPEGVSVWVATWMHHENEDGVWLQVSARAREVKLSCGTDGKWFVTGEGMQRASHW